jgi:hypothetical protein
LGSGKWALWQAPVPSGEAACNQIPEACEAVQNIGALASARTGQAPATSELRYENTSFLV